MASSAAVQVVRQRHRYDCGLAALAMLLGLPYGDVAAAARRAQVDVTAGMNGQDVRRVAKALGTVLVPVRRSTGYLVGVSGILGLLPNSRSSLPAGGHWCLYRDGVIVDTDGTVWPQAADYWRKRRCRPVTLLVRRAAT